MTNHNPEAAAVGLASAVRANAVRTLLQQGKRPDDQAVEQQGRWLLALWHAEQAISTNTLKDWAQCFLDGLQPITSVQDECRSLTDDEDVGNELLDFLSQV